MGSLKKYRAKRHLEETSEPQAEISHSKTGKLKFVVQKHQASHLHYDLRLELNGVLKSWAVPKGIPSTSAKKHLAIEVEDHPMKYASFEGTIPEGHYGAGTVEIWDKGTYSVLDAKTKKEAEKIAQAQFKKGHLHIVFHGDRLKGPFSLIRMMPKEGKSNWLLIKNKNPSGKKS